MTNSGKLLERITMFNDAVYAIALTLLVLELKLPENAKCDTSLEMWQLVKEMGPKLIAFLLSVAVVGGNWLRSVNIQRAQKGADIPYMIFLIIYLSLISLSPFTCNLIGSYPNNPVSYLMFGGVMIIININAFFFMRYCRRMKMYHSDVDTKAIAKNEKIVMFIAVFVAGIAVVAFYSTKLSLGLFLIYSLLPFITTKSLAANHESKEHASQG